MAALLRAAIAARGEANVILATGNSQLAFLRALRVDRSVDWSKVRVFHMDEYVGIDPATAPPSRASSASTSSTTSRARPSSR
jgi:6-phosphogluconolactonase/glucosamine-6-phosphate isomerase/deaminase